MSEFNDHLVLIGGKSAGGKSASLRNLVNPEGVMYLNCESGKKLPFKSKFRELVITDPYDVYQAIEEAESMPDIHTIVVDTVTYLMDMFESQYVLTATNTMKAWGDYSQFFKNLMQQYVAKSTKRIIFLAHTSDVMNEEEGVMETMVKVKGSLMNQGIESFFSTVVSAKKVRLKDLKDYENDLLVISEEEKLLDFKYVYQTRITKKSVGERIRGPFSMWDTAETFIDNDAEKLLTRLDDYYGS